MTLYLLSASLVIWNINNEFKIIMETILNLFSKSSYIKIGESTEVWKRSRDPESGSCAKEPITEGSGTTDVHSTYLMFNFSFFLLKLNLEIIREAWHATVYGVTKSQTWVTD